MLAEIIEANKTIKFVSLQQNMITDVGARRLAMALHVNQSLEELILDQNQIGDQGLVSLAKSMLRLHTHTDRTPTLLTHSLNNDHSHRKLRRLALNGNEIGDKGVATLCQAMLVSQAEHGEPHFFPSVELSANKIGDLGCEALAKLVNKNHTITTLSLSSNLITDKGLGYIVEAVSTPDTLY